MRPERAWGINILLLYDLLMQASHPTTLNGFGPAVKETNKWVNHPSEPLGDPHMGPGEWSKVPMGNLFVMLSPRSTRSLISVLSAIIFFRKHPTKHGVYLIFSTSTAVFFCQCE